MKIGIDCRMCGLKHAGIGRYVQNLVEELMVLDEKNEYVLFVRDDTELTQNAKRPPALLRNAKWAGKTQNDSSKPKTVIADIPHYSLKEQLLFPWLIYREKPDLMHFPHFNVPVLYRGKYVVTIHDLIKHTSRGMATTTKSPFLYWIKYLGYKIVFWSAVKRSSKILVPSQWVKDELIKEYRINPKKIVVTYEGVDDKFQIPNSKLQTNSKFQILKKYEIKKPFILYVGSVYPHKNIERLMEAIKILNRSLITNHQPPTTLVIVCARSVFLERLKSKIKDFGADEFVKLAGFVPDEELVVLYKEAEAFVFSSLSEGFGLPGLEAMAFGTPVVCSDIPVLREVYEKAAIFFDPQDEKDMAEKIFKVLSNKELQRQMKVLGVKQAAKYSWSKMVRETLRTYNYFSGGVNLSHSTSVKSQL